ncbi:hypothetical protein ATY81_17360 [Rhizobium sp. R72]|uniref:hypothetical protein n=1 Tax=unclassified Rhizobium TaxID=2613769 RepID=UPI000B537029|nr:MULTISPECIES: hypothetical protein [unclassified Rhizobium]OWW04093.1 hypothetical protein ATY81_17360 [Rhizobium sp. R72]OWW04296.1 hypothetical protein ATY80_17360 [Rhizobium sp. R711]
MRTAILTLMRLGPSLAYTIAAVFLISMLLLDNYPANPSAWWTYMILLPIMREPIYLLFAVPGVEIWSAMVLLMLASLFGIRLALRAQQYPRTVFIHAHVALIATGLTMGRAAVAQAGLSGLSLPQLLRGDWSLLPLSYSPPGTIIFAFVLSACICSHMTIIKHARRPAEQR